MGRFRLACLIATGVVCAVVAATELEVGGPEVTRAIQLVGAVAAASVAAWACARGAASQGGSARRGWLLLAGSGIGWAAHAALIAASELVFDQRFGSPSLADVPATVAAVCALLGMLAFLKPSLTSTSRMRVLLDAFLIAASLLFVAWNWTLRDVYARHGDVPGRIVALLYPVADVVVTALVVVAVIRAPRRARLAWALLAAGLFLVMLGDGTLAYLQLADMRFSGGTLALGRVLGWVLVTLAALAPNADATSTDQRHPQLRDIFVPMVPAVVAGTVCFFQWRAGRLDTFLSANAAVLLVLVLARQVLAQYEHLDLTRTLEWKVRERTDELRRREEQFRSLVAHSSDVVTVVDADGSIRYQSLSVLRVLGYSRNELPGTSLDRLVHDEDRSRLRVLLDPTTIAPGESMACEIRLARADGSWCRTETTVANLLQNPAVQGLVLTSRDIGDRKDLEDQLRHRAFHDTLTGLGNRALFRDRLEHAVRRVSRYGGDIGVLFIDLDGFKSVNDTLGHDAGDRLLREVAGRIQASIRTSDTVARMGGDEFAVLLEQAADAQAAEVVADRILAALQLPIHLEGGVETRAGCSIGIALAEAAQLTSADDLLRDADLAMYRAKSRGKGRAEQFEQSLREAALNRANVERELRRAIAEHELVLHYQPVVELPGGRVSGVEALVRWNHPTRGLVPPGEFIPVAEESDLIVELGRWALMEACRQVKAIQDSHPAFSDLWLSVNVATRQLLQPGLVQAVRAALLGSGFDPHCLILEITEGALLNDPKASAGSMLALKELGIRIAIDDFGTGYSSLSRLRSFPVDKLKIDRSFISEIRHAGDEAPIVAAVMAMAHGLGLTAVAEGVETLAQLACLHQQGCEEVQGFLLARPMAVEAFDKLLSDPSGLLDISDSQAAVSPRGPADGHLSELVRDASRQGAAFEEVTRPLLAELARRTGLEATWLARMDLESGSLQVVLSHGGDSVSVPEGTMLPAERRAGPVLAMGQQMPGALADLGARSYVAVPVVDGDGRVVGSLAAAGVGDEPPSASTTVLLELFTRLVAEGATLATKAAAATA